MRLLQLKTIFSISNGSATGDKMNFLNRGIYMILNVAASEVKLQIECRVPPIYIRIYIYISMCNTASFLSIRSKIVALSGETGWVCVYSHPVS